MTALRMLEKDQTRNELKFLNQESHSNQGINHTGGLPSKRVWFLGLSALVVLSIFILGNRTRQDYGRQLNLAAEASGGLSSDHDSTSWMSLVSRRPQKVTRRPKDVSRYVSFSGGFADGRGLGNQIFCFAAIIYVAQLTGREPAIEKFNYVIQLDSVFDLNVEKFDSLCPCSWIEESKHLAFDEQTDKKVLESQDTINKSILVDGFRQSWRYTMGIERRLRRHLVFKEDFRKFAEDYLEKHVPPDWKRAGFSRVAIHVRRGDILQQSLIDYGYTVPNANYFLKAMNYFSVRYRRVQFITFSQDDEWVRENIRADKNRTHSIHVTHSVGHSTGQDLAIISMCDHVIMSTGTFGWWGGWLAKGTTVYYSNWPRNGSSLGQQFSREDFFPHNWIPMGD